MAISPAARSPHEKPETWVVNAGTLPVGVGGILVGPPQFRLRLTIIITATAIGPLDVMFWCEAKWDLEPLARMMMGISRLGADGI